MYFTWDNMKYFFFCIALLLSLGQFVSCSDSDDLSHSPKIDVSSDSLSGMMLVKVADVSVVLGTNDKTAKSDERPEMKVTLDYDFSIGKSEVTCGEFNAVMKSVTGLVLDCKNDSLPATDVTFYDAVLFANARSVAEKRDTAYSYNKASFDDKKHCTNLDGFAFHPDVNAYRLPTEAEWVLVAETSWNPSKGWTAENSDYKLHKVCSVPNADKNVCDMAGNAMEWVNDWLGNFRDTVLTNYVGASDGGPLGQRVVKGGSYRNSSKSIKLFNRGDVYIVTSSTRADYVGFRLAFGAIANATWLNASGNVVASRVVPLVGATTIRSLLGTYRTKIVFRNDVSGNLAFVDFSGGTNSVTEINDTLEVYHPEISPDGKKVAFCTKFEGLSGKSVLYVRDLNADGTNLVKLDVNSAAIPRWRVLENGDTVIVYVTDAGNNKEESSFMSASTWQVKFAKGKFGKPQKLFDGAFHGGISEDNLLTVTGARLLRARIADSGASLAGKAKDELWYNGEQACNASLAKDGSKRTAFLDFGGKTGRKFVGETYGTHERLLIANAQGKLIQSVKAPSGYSYDHSEWVAGSNLIVATLSNSNGAHPKVVVVNLADSSVVDLLEGEELWHPNLWMNSNSSLDTNVFLDLDSAGIYLSEDHQLVQVRFRIKMEKFWKNLSTTQVVLIGSSRMEMGTDPDLFPEWNMLNFGVTGIDAERNYYFIYNYILNHSERLKAIVISIDLDFWRGLEGHLGFVLSSGVGYTYDANHSFWKDGVPVGFVDAVENAYPAPFEDASQFSDRGGTTIPCRSWNSDGVDVLHDSLFTDSDMKYLNKNLKELENLTKQAAKKNIYVIGIIFPQAPQYKKTGAFGTYGMQRSIAKEKIAYLDSLAKSNKYFILMDENKMGNHDYSDEMSSNRDHLCWRGAQKLTTRIDSILKTLKW